MLYGACGKIVLVVCNQNFFRLLSVAANGAIPALRWKPPLRCRQPAQDSPCCFLRLESRLFYFQRLFHPSKIHSLIFFLTIPFSFDGGSSSIVRMSFGKLSPSAIRDFRGRSSRSFVSSELIKYAT